MTYKTIYTEVEVEVEVNMSDFDTDDLIEELERRGAGDDYGDGKEILQAIYEKRRLGLDYQIDLDHLIWNGLGKVL